MSTNLEMQVNETQAGLYTVTYGYKHASLDVQEATFALHKLGIISPAQLGFLRAKEARGTFKPYSGTGADLFYDDRGNKVVIVPDGAISKQVGIANLVDAHRQGKEYVIPKNQRELIYALVDEMLKKDTAFSANHGRTDVSVSEFGEIELTSRLFSDEERGTKAQDYGDWLAQQGIRVQSICFNVGSYVQSQKGPYLNRLRVFGPENYFFVEGDGWGLNGGAFGVRFEKTAKGGAKK